MVRRPRPWLTRRTGDDPDVDRINEIANELVVATLALDMDDEATLRRALDDARGRASRLLADAVIARDARERRRYVGLWASGATTTAAAAIVAALVLLPPTPGPDQPTPVASALAPVATTVDQAERSTMRPTAPPAVITAGGELLVTREAALLADETQLATGAGVPETTPGRGAGPSTPGAGPGAGERPAPDGPVAPEPATPVHPGAEASGGRAEPVADPAQLGPAEHSRGNGSRRNA